MLTVVVALPLMAATDTAEDNTPRARVTDFMVKIGVKE